MTALTHTLAHLGGMRHTKLHVAHKYVYNVKARIKLLRFRAAHKSCRVQGPIKFHQCLSGRPVDARPTSVVACRARKRPPGIACSVEICVFSSPRPAGKMQFSARSLLMSDSRFTGIRVLSSRTESRAHSAQSQALRLHNSAHCCGATLSRSECSSGFSHTILLMHTAENRRR